MEYLIVFLPLLAAVYTGFGSRLISVRQAQVVTCIAVCVSAILSGVVFYNVAILGVPETLHILRWMHSGAFSVSWSLKIDQLTAVMLVVVTWVSALVHIYSVGYMAHDPHPQRFMAYLSLFTFFMLMLVTANDFVQLYLGWEGVGLSSYLLIGFWYEKPSANAAAMKAFIVNRVGDFGFAIGIFSIFLVFGNVHFADVFAAAAGKATDIINIGPVQFPVLDFICVMLFIGAMGKSAQIGLHTWLPDAMEGPTPVSALIHAATMVTAGVFLVARCSPLFEYAPHALMMVTVVGAVTCLFAGTIAITQNDIKKIIAYSTCSQLGYMFFACGISAYSAGIFHLMTHAFFKALLFLGAGSVIHAMSDEQDIRRMGGIWKKIPITYTLFWIGSLALAGIPFFSGYFSKDAILESAYAAGDGIGHFAFYMGLAAAFLTAFYSWRLIIITFHGAPRASHETMHHIHESPSIMLIPLYFLGLGSLFAGAIGYYLLHMVSPDGAFWGGAIKVLQEHNVLEKIEQIPALAEFAPLIAGIGGIAIAYLFYMLRPEIPGKIASAFPFIYKFLLNKWYFDELYDWLFVRPAKRIGNWLWRTFDIRLIDGFGPNGAAFLTRFISIRFGIFQSGYVYHYAFVIIVGLIGFIGWFVYRSAG